MKLRLGVIGLSVGNGHPYSWSAIFNGYSPEDMRDCGFPAIPQYLSEQRWPEAKIADVEVTHVWAGSREISNRVARAALIRHVVESPEDMLGQIDALLLARDDAENHLRYASPFLKAGVPVYIDKPVALSLAALNALYNLQQYEGQIFTCSALRYDPDLALDAESRKAIGTIRLIQASVPKSWDCYAVHIIEPVLNMLGDQARPVTTEATGFGAHGRSLVVGFSGGVTAQFSSLGAEVVAPISIRLYGEGGWRDFLFSDAFRAFKAALQDFVDGIRSRTCRSSRQFNERVVSIIEAGRSR